jgi:hypothetical protein
VTSIGYRAFAGCSALESLTFLSPAPPALNSTVFYNLPATGTLYYPEGAEATYTDGRFATAGLPAGWTFATAAGPGPSVGEPASGDLNGDGVVTTAEALTAARAAVIGIVAAELDDAQVAALDMDSDGHITMADVMFILRKAVGL